MDEMHLRAAQEALLRAFLAADRAAAARLRAEMPTGVLLPLQRDVMHSLTERHLAGELPFCALTAAAEAAEALWLPDRAPAVCLGSVPGNTSPTGLMYMEMLLRAWNVPYLLLGSEAAPEAFVDGALACAERTAVCSVFTSADLAQLHEIHEAALRRGVRERLRLVAFGTHEPEEGFSALPLDVRELRTAAVAAWVGLL